MDYTTFPASILSCKLVCLPVNGKFVIVWSQSGHTGEVAANQIKRCVLASFPDLTVIGQDTHCAVLLTTKSQAINLQLRIGKTEFDLCLPLLPRQARMRWKNRGVRKVKDRLDCC